VNLSGRDEVFKTESMDHVALAVSDLEASERWYAETLGLERRFEEAWSGPPVMMCVGETCVALFRAREGEPLGTEKGLRHVAFRVDRPNFEACKEGLGAKGLEFSEADHGVSQSVYFRDPDGYLIEVTTYEIGS
jgi:catechol 2,3-dioxygenase-like lactoylglutathione lyase family enzyme